MKNPSKIAAKLTTGGALALLLATSAFAESSHQKETHHHGNDGGRPSSSNSSRESHQTNRAAEAARAGRTQVRPDVVNRNESRNNGGARNDSYRYDRNSSRTDARREAARNDSYRSYNSNRYNNDRRYDNNRYNNDHRYDRGHSSSYGYRYRNNARFEYRVGVRNAYRGTIRSFNRERGGYRVYLSGGPYSYWVPDSFLFGHPLRVGLSLRLGGVFRGGYIAVDALGWPGYNDTYYNQPYYDDVYYDGSGSDIAVGAYGNDGYVGGDYDNGDVVRGRIERVDLRSQTLVVRDDDASGRYVTVDMRSVDRRGSRLDLADLRPGDRVSLTGGWLRGNVFSASRIETIDAY
jgi:hypothetical protein